MPTRNSSVMYVQCSQFLLVCSTLSLQVRQFMIKMREFLLNQYRTDLLSHGMDACQNFEHLLEATLQQCIVKVVMAHLPAYHP